MTLCQTFSNFLSTTNLIGSSDAPTVKGEQDWTMPAGIEQTVGRTWPGMFGMRQEFPPIGLFRGNYFVYIDASVWRACFPSSV